MKAFFEQYIGPIIYWGYFVPVGFMSYHLKPFIGEWPSLIAAVIIYCAAWDCLVKPKLIAVFGPILGPIFDPFTRLFASIGDAAERCVKRLWQRMGLPMDCFTRKPREYDPYFEAPEEKPDRPAPTPHLETFTATTEDFHG